MNNLGKLIDSLLLKRNLFYYPNRIEGIAKFLALPEEHLAESLRACPQVRWHDRWGYEWWTVSLSPTGRGRLHYLRRGPLNDPAVQDFMRTSSEYLRWSLLPNRREVQLPV